MEIHRDDPIYPVTPRWSIGLRDNWSGEYHWITFSSYRDTIRRIRMVMCNLIPTVTAARPPARIYAPKEVA